MQRVAIVLAAVVLGGCVAQPVYQWGGYEDKLYAGYKDQTKMEELKSGLETHIAALDASSQKVAPGLYAELGTLYLQSGNTVKAKVMYERERNAWPESKTLMNALIQNLDRRLQAQTAPPAEKPK
jgi:hypothetical protein